MKEAPQDLRASAPTHAPDTQGSDPEKVILELCFLAVVGAILTAAFLRALTYDIVSARPPLVILTPLLVLVGVRLRRLWLASHTSGIKSALRRLVAGENRQYAKAGELFAWIFLLLAFIYLGGHYLGIAVFMFLLMRGVAGEPVVLSAWVAVVVTLGLYLLFELGFEIELYRGLIYRIWAGYDVT